MELILRDIRKSYGKQEILKGLSLNIELGKCTGVTGRNGCGKTTLISILAGSETADSGQVIIPKKGFKVGYLPQINPLLDYISVEENLNIWAENKVNLQNALEKYDLTDIRKKAIHKLSGGMKRRVAIACALVNNPDLLIMDEPTAALDIEYKKIIHDEMNRYVTNGGTIVMVTHEKEEIDMCDICYLISDGTIKGKMEE